MSLSDKGQSGGGRRPSATGPRPQYHGAEREFLQQRIAVFGKVGCLLSVCFYVMVNLLTQVGRPRPFAHWVTEISNLAILAVAIILGALWVVGRGRRLSLSFLRSLDAAGTGLLGAGCAVHGWWGGGLEVFKFNALLATTNILIFRAILLPSSVRRTAILGAVAFLPSVVPAYFVWLSPPGGVDPRTLQVEMAFINGWAFVAVAVSSVVSLVVYDLRDRMREAQRLGQYTLEERIGRGGMGEVYRASHAMLRRPTAIKLLRPDQASEESISRFEREVQLSSRLTHPNTIAIFDYGRTPDGIFYYAMEYLPGLNLAEVVARSGPQPPGRVIHILVQVCASLSEAHAAGLIHRDIKAPNIILCERGGLSDVAKVVDFGLVKSVAELQRPDALVRGDVLGTVLYLAPEAITTPGRVDHRTDLYALGVVGYYLLTGEHPFSGRSAREVFDHHLRTEPLPPSRGLHQDIPGDLEARILSCLAKDPRNRPQSAEVLRQRLAECEHSSAWTQPDAEAWWKEHGGATPGMPISEELATTIQGVRHAP